MRKNNSTRNLVLGSLALLLSHGAMQADKTWQGTTTPNVSNENLYINANCQLTPTGLVDYVSVTASTQNVHVYLTQASGPTIINAGTASTLFLEAEDDLSVTFSVTQDLQFTGPSGLGTVPLFVAARGGGNIIFDIDGGSSVTLTTSAGGGSGVNFYVIMDGTVLQFNRNIAINPDQNIFVTTGTGSVLGYATNNPLSSEEGLGTILFDPTNSGAGIMALQVMDTSNVLVSGRLIQGQDEESYSLDLSNITATPAGCTAIFEVTNSNVADSSRLLVLNSNNTLPLAEIWHPDTYLDLTAYGFILGTNGKLSVDSLAYFDYVGLSVDTCLTGSVYAPCCLVSSAQPCACNLGNTCAACDFADLCWIQLATTNVFKKRNPSALIVDGYDDPSAVPACINLDTQSAIVFRSGVDCSGVVENPDPSSEYAFTISSTNRTTGPGYMVLDVEGCLTIAGTGTDPFVNPTKIEILSLNVTPTGATVLINGTGSLNFPARDFAEDSFGNLISYNSGYFFINSNVILCKTFLVHTDQNHKIYDSNSICSEPTYVGGEGFMLTDLTGTWTAGRPKLLFSNSTVFFHTSAAVTGVDLEVPNALDCCLSCSAEAPTRGLRSRCIDCNQMAAYPCHRSRGFAKMHNLLKSKNATRSCLSDSTPCDNLSNFTFFYNGYALDNGTGRQLILGTYLGAYSCDCSTEISQDAHLDVMQLAGQSCTCENIHELVLTVLPNNDTIIHNVPSNIAGQYGVNTIYLGHASNISIGGAPEDTVFTSSSCPILLIDGDYFSFGTYGGLAHNPGTSNITGQGGIFVDANGTIQAINTCGVNMGAMVTKSGNGIIDLPDPIVRFGCAVGEADWLLNLSTTPTIVLSGTVIADYVLPWNTCCKQPGFLPFVCDCTSCPANQALAANVNGIPLVLGDLGQLRIYGSRIGDPAHVKVGLGGNIRELVFEDNCVQGFVPTAVVVLEDGGRVGLNTAHTNVDSLGASIVLGNNGITIIANGDGRVYLNEDVVINNVCHIVQGPDFTSNNRLLITSEEDKTIRVKSTGVLDLSSFSDGGTVEIGGNVRLVLEPGAKVVHGTVELKFSGKAGIFCEPVAVDLLPTSTTPAGLTTLDPYRVIFSSGTTGLGTVRFTGCSYFTINNNAFAGVQTSTDCSLDTNLMFILEDSAQWSIGACNRIGGAFDVGNTSDNGTHAMINFTLSINGNDAQFYICQGAFVGLGSVIALKPSASVPNTWVVGQAYNVGNINIVNSNGVFSHNVIWDGNTSTDAQYLVGSALVIGGQTTANYILDFTGDDSRRVANLSCSTMRGGGNLVLVGSFTPAQLQIGDLNTATVGIMASGPLYKAGFEAFTGTGSGLFAFWSNADVGGSATQYNSRCDIGPFIRNEMMAGYIDRGYIQRSPQIKIIGSAGATTDQAHSKDIGAAAIRLVPATSGPRDIQDMRILA